MQYMLMMNVPRATGDYQIRSWAPEDVAAHMQFMHDFNRDLAAAGEFVDAQGLTAPGEARLVRMGTDGRPATDGPFAETKEFLAGYWIVDVESAERAYELAARVSAAPGRGGAPVGLAIEVRQVLSGLPRDA